MAAACQNRSSQSAADGKFPPRTEFSGDGRPRGPTRRLPWRSGPWRCRAAVPRRERARLATWLFGRRGAAHPSSPTPPGPRAVARIRARNLTSHRSSLRRPRGAASYAPNLSCHTLPLRAETHKYTTYRSCNGRQPQPIPARRIQQCSGSTCCWGSRRGRRRSSRHDPRRCTGRPRRRGTTSRHDRTPPRGVQRPPGATLV